MDARDRLSMKAEQNDSRTNAYPDASKVSVNLSNTAFHFGAPQHEKWYPLHHRHYKKRRAFPAWKLGGMSDAIASLGESCVWGSGATHSPNGTQPLILSLG